MRRKIIPEEALIDLQRRMDLFPERAPERPILAKEVADLYGVSRETIYRRLRDRAQPRALRRKDRGRPRFLSEDRLRLYCELIAAVRVRTMNQKGRILPVGETIRLLEEFGFQTPDGLVKAPPGLLKVSTVNRYLRLWGYDRKSLAIQSPAVRFQADFSSQCWHFDLSQSDLKKLDKWPSWVRKDAGRPLLMLYSIVDDRSRVAYQEYHVVYGEDVEAALRFLFAAMAPKDIPGFPFEGIPEILYMDNGPISRSSTFRRVIDLLGIDLRRHIPQSKAKRKAAARAKSKVEKPFDTIKQVHETLYHFNEPENVGEANHWLRNYNLRYNERDHPEDGIARIQAWIDNLPQNGIREMCSWERFTSFAREPESAYVGIDARLSLDGVEYDVLHDLAEQKVIAWRGLLDDEIYVEFEEKKYGPYSPTKGPISLGQYRAFKKTEAEKRVEHIEQLAEVIALSRDAMTTDTRVPECLLRQLPQNLRRRSFEDPDPFQELNFPSIFEAKRGIADHLSRPLAELHESTLEKIDRIVHTTLHRRTVVEEVDRLFRDLQEDLIEEGEV